LKCQELLHDLFGVFFLYHVIFLLLGCKQNQFSTSNASLHLRCHPERSEGSQVFGKARFFALLRMTDI
jgi:hypothetical protein